MLMNAYVRSSKNENVYFHQRIGNQVKRMLEWTGGFEPGANGDVSRISSLFCLVRLRFNQINF